jgi:hypothetical protein
MVRGLLVVVHVVGSLDALNILKASLEDRANKIGEAVNVMLAQITVFQSIDRLQSDEGECFQGFLECTLVDKAWRIRPAAGAGVVVLSGEDEGCEPEVGEDPGKWPHIPLVLVRSGKNQSGNIKNNVDSSL